MLSRIVLESTFLSNLNFLPSLFITQKERLSLNICCYGTKIRSYFCWHDRFSYPPFIIIMKGKYMQEAKPYRFNLCSLFSGAELHNRIFLFHNFKITYQLRRLIPLQCDSLIRPAVSCIGCLDFFGKSPFWWRESLFWSFLWISELLCCWICMN